jgi:hypothetical protein
MQKVERFLGTSGRFLASQFLLVILAAVVIELITWLGHITSISTDFLVLLILVLSFATALMRGLKMQTQSQGTVMGLYSLFASLLSFSSFFSYYAVFSRLVVPNVFWSFFTGSLPWTIALTAIGISIAVFIRYRQATRFSILLSMIGCMMAMGFLGFVLFLVWALMGD